MVHNKPVFEVNPIYDNIISEDFHTEIKKADISEISPATVKELNAAVNTPKEHLYNI